MIKYKYGILDELKEKGFSTYRLRKEKILSESTIQDIRAKKEIELETPNRLCELLKCDIGDILEYVPDDEN